MLAFLLVLPSFAGQPQAQREAFTLEQVLGFTFPSELTASPSGSRVAWALLQRGVRSLWVADGPQFEPRQLFSSEGEDGQELTHLAFSADGRHLVYVRGGDHGSNWAAEGNLMPNPTSSPVEPKTQVWAVAVDGGGEPTLIGEGDEPVLAPQDDGVVFKKGRELWAASIDGRTRAARLFFARGDSESPEWSPDGKTLAFVSNRGDQSYIGLYGSAEEPLRYLAPSSSRDSMPRWSPDGTRIAFVRRPGRGGPMPSPLEPEPQPWAIWLADVETGHAREVWTSPETARGSYPRVAGGANLMWGTDDRLVFLSYHDGWPHLYAVDTTAENGEPQLLTPGELMVEHMTLTPDRSSVIYSANTGDDEQDGERRHLFMVSVDGGSPTALTSGTGLEWAPTITGDGESIAYLASTAAQPPLPVVRALGESSEPRTLLSDQLSPDFPANALVEPEDVVINALDGTRVHAQLFKQVAGPSRRPAIVFAHGGPARQMLLGWHYMFYYANTYAMNQYLASRGYIVLSVNYRLGIGYGFEFHQPPRAGVRGASEYQDVLAAGGYLQKRVDVDPARIGIWGGSYGGYLTALGLAQNSDVFAAGADLHGVHNRLQLASTEQQAAALAGDGITRADLEEAAKVAWESAPAAHVKTWRSPVLLVHGDDDRNVRVEQTVDLVQRLRAAEVPFEEIIIPDDIHDFLLYRNWLRVYRAVADFFDRHLHPEKGTG
ncbi:MAG: prolyl oligopeptidase family serine peptidase [Luteitalea sp.]|nr:prolyl oligopeptidase family serine peptidase [Luteitalea sp.]